MEQLSTFFRRHINASELPTLKQQGNRPEEFEKRLNNFINKTRKIKE